MPIGWQTPQLISPRSWVCWSCTNQVASSQGWAGAGHEDIRICPMCGYPTFFDDSGRTFPSAPAGNTVDHLPSDVAELYRELRVATSTTSYASAVMVARKILMHVGVEQGAPVGQNFVAYVDYLRDNLVATQSATWVDQIRTLGNEANHEIRIPTKDEVDRVLAFVEMLLRLAYEFPARGGAGAGTSAPPATT